MEVTTVRFVSFRLHSSAAEILLLLASRPVMGTEH